MRVWRLMIGIALFAVISASTAQAVTIADFESSHGYTAGLSFDGVDGWNGQGEGSRLFVTGEGQTYDRILSGDQSGRIRKNGHPLKYIRDGYDTITSIGGLQLWVNVSATDEYSDPYYVGSRGMLATVSTNPAPNHPGLYWRFWQYDNVGVDDGDNDECELLIYSWADDDGEGDMDSDEWYYRRTGIKGFGYGSNSVTRTNENNDQKNLIKFSFDWDNNEVTIYSEDWEDGNLVGTYDSGPWYVLLKGEDGSGNYHDESSYADEAWIQFWHYGSAVTDYNDVNGGYGKVIYDDIEILEGTAPIPGDANGDGKVDSADLNIVSDNWQGTGKTWAEGDFNGDGVVDSADLNILSDNWQSGGSAPSVPEPTSIVMILFGLAGIVRRKS